MAIRKQISTLLVNKPGTLARVCSALKRNKVNILAISIENMVDSCVLHTVVDNTDAGIEAIKKIGLPVVLTPVLVLTLTDRPGALGEVAGKLTKAGVNIEYVYGSGVSGKGLVVFRVSDVNKAAKAVK